MAANEPVDGSNQNQSQKRPTFMATNSSATGKVALGVSWDGFRYTVKEDGVDKPILKGLSGSALPGRTLAIMGSSGAGKTTFLNALADRLNEDATHILEGTMRFNDVPYEHKYRKLLGFVTQDDIVSSMATPTDAFRFSLRIRRGTGEEETNDKVEDMLEELGLNNCRDTLVGIPGVVAGLSGGEKKRCNIGVELISDPKVLLLDEPTSGLDSVTASRIVTTCRDLAQHGRTVIFTIHQPTADCVSAFDDLMLMCAGSIAYHGTMDGSLAYFAAIGYNCPDTYTPTDYFMTLLQDPEIGPELVEKWEAHIQGGHASAHVLTPQPASTKNEPTVDTEAGAVMSAGETKTYLDQYVANTGSSIGVQFKELLRRSFLNVKRNKMFVGMSVMQSVFFALVSGVIFVNLKDDVTGVQDRMGVLFMVSANRCFSGAMMMINTFPPEKAVFIREQQSGAYSPGIYFLAKSLSELPVQTLGVILESLILYFMTGLVIDAARYFHYLAITWMLFQAATGLGMLISCSVPNFQLASGLAPLAIVPMMLAGGLLGSTDRLRWGWVWLEKLSIVRYGFVLFARNEFEGLDTIGCNPNEFKNINGTAFCSRQPTNGKQVLSNFELDGGHHEYWLMWLCLILWAVVMRILCVVALNKVARSKA